MENYCSQLMNQAKVILFIIYEEGQAMIYVYTFVTIYYVYISNNVVVVAVVASLSSRTQPPICQLRLCFFASFFYLQAHI